jgi:hypothetical protein
MSYKQDVMCKILSFSSGHVCKRSRYRPWQYYEYAVRGTALLWVLQGISGISGTCTPCTDGPACIDCRSNPNKFQCKSFNLVSGVAGSINILALVVPSAF